MPSPRRCTVLLTASVLLVTACATPARRPTDFTPKLIVFVQEDRAFYYRNETDHWVGFSHELIERMQRQLGVPVDVRSFADYDTMVRAFAAGAGDIMCPAVTLNRASPSAAWMRASTRLSGRRWAAYERPITSYREAVTRPPFRRAAHASRRRDRRGGPSR